MRAKSKLMRSTLASAVGLCLIVGAGPAFANHHKEKHNGLPPGLQKKVDRGQPLPPGWQKKVSQGAILELDLFKLAHVVRPPDPLGVLTLRLEDKILRVHEKTREIIEILH